MRLTDEEILELERKKALKKLKHIECRGLMGECMNHRMGRPECVWPFCGPELENEEEKS